MINFLAISFRNGFYAVSYSGKCFLNGEISLQLRKSHCYAVQYSTKDVFLNGVSSLKRLIVALAFKYIFCFLCISIKENIHLHLSWLHDEP